MALSKNAKDRLAVALTDKSAGDEVAETVDQASSDISNIQSGSNDYSGSRSHQVVGPDMNVSEDVGSDDGSNPKFIATIMGNLIGDALSNAANYLAGVIGAFSVTGAKATSYPAGAVLAQISDGVTAADGAVVAYVDGDSAVTKANAAFKAMSNNSNAGSGFDYGMDLFGAAHDGYNELAILKADLRMSKEVCFLNGLGDPTDGGAGTGAGYAGTGSQYVDRTATSTALWINVGTKASPAWKKMARFEDI